jgi:PAS domain S-box-containing protein
MAKRIRAFDWATTPLGSVKTWSDRLKLMVEQMLANPLVSTLVCGPERLLIYNDAAAKLYGRHHPAALGQPLPRTFSEGWATVALFYGRAFAGETVVVADQPLDTRGEGEVTDVFDALLMPVREADGQVAYVLMTGSETSGRARAEAALRASEAQYRYLFNAIDEGFCIVEVLFDAAGQPHDYRFLSVNAAFEEQTGLQDAVGQRMRELAPDHEAHWFETYGRIARTGQPERFEHRAEALGRWYDVYAFRTGAPEQRQVGILFKDIQARKHADIALRQSEERHAFLLTLGDAMRAQSDANAIIEVAARLLGERLNASRILFAEFDEAKGIADIFFGWFADGSEPFPAVMRLEEYQGPILDDLRAGRVVRIGDTNDSPLTRPDLAGIAQLGVAALLSVPLLVGGRLLVNLSVHQHTARRWTDDEVALAQEVAERLWADLVRARAEAALRESEERYRSLFQRMGQGYCELELLRDKDGRAVDQRYITLNPAFERLFGIRVAEAVGRTASEVFPNLEPWWHEAFNRIAEHGRPERIEYSVAALGRWFEVFVYPAGRNRLTVLYEDVTDRHRAEKALRASEERQAFLLKLSDAIRPLAGASEIQATTTHMLGAHLALDRAMYAEVEGELGKETGTIRGQYVRPAKGDLPSVTPFPERFAYGPYGERTMPGRYRGDLLVVADIDAAGGFEASERAAWAAAKVRAAIVAPLVKGGRLVAEFGVHSAIPRAWTDHEVSLVRDVAERTWAAAERARAEAAMRAGEERLRLFGNASSDVLWMRDAETLQWIYLTPAFEAIYGLDRETALRGDNMTGWLDLIVPEDRSIAFDTIQSVRSGQPISFEYRIRRPGDGAVRWVRNTDFPMRDPSGQVCWLGGVGRDITEEKASAQRQEVLVNELQHRARNLLGVISAVAGRTLRQGGSVETFEDRLQALSRVQGLLSEGGSDTVELASLVRAELAAYVDAGSDRISVAGPRVYLSAAQVQNFALAVHELTTNAVKYGALRDNTGHLAVKWEVVLNRRERRQLALNWIESGVVVDLAKPQHRGYGSELIQHALAYALQAKVEYMLGEDGMRCRIEMPIA